MSLKNAMSNIEEIKAKRAQAASEEVQKSLNALVNSDVFNTQLDTGMTVEKLVNQAVSTAVDPRTQYISNLKAMGLRQAHIRKLTDILYHLYIDASPKEDILYDDMIVAVSEYVYLHQEIYNSLNLDTLLNEGV